VTAVVSYSVAGPAATTPPSSANTSPAFGAPAIGGPVALPPITVPPPSAAGQSIADQAVQPPPVLPVAGTIAPHGFRYPIVFGLPLALLVVIGLAGDGLTRPVRLREEAA
jgi:hypothetical protein